MNKQAAFTTFRQTTVQPDGPGENPHEPFGRRFTFVPNFASIKADINEDGEKNSVFIFAAIAPHRFGLTSNQILPEDQDFIQGYYGFPNQVNEPEFKRGVSSAEMQFQGVPAQNYPFTPKYTSNTVSLVVRNVPLKEFVTDNEGNPTFSPFMPNPIPPVNLDNPQRDNPINPESPVASGD